MFYTNDPVADAENYLAEQEKELDKLPQCSECDNPITTEHCFEVNDELICPECMDNNHRKWVEDYVQ